jgi:hypothetical protein
MELGNSVDAIFMPESIILGQCCRHVQYLVLPGFASPFSTDSTPPRLASNHLTDLVTPLPT